MSNAVAQVGVLPMRYEIASDELVVVTQEWVNQTQADILRLGKAITALRKLAALSVPEIAEFGSKL